MGYILIPIIIILILGIRIVTPQTIKTVEFLGRFTRILRPGLNIIIPIIEITRHQDLFRKNFAVEVDGITSDNVTVYVGLNVVFFVQDDKNDTTDGSIYKSVYSINDPRTLMASTIDEQLRAMVSTFGHKEIFNKREEIGQSIEENLREKLSQFGYTLDSIQVRSIKLEANVTAAMNKVVESSKLKEAAQNEGEAEKIMQVKRAEADKEAKILIGQGMAGQRMEIAKGFKESVDLIMSSDKSLTGDKILKFLLDSSRIETLGNIGNSDKTKLIYLNEDLEGRAMNKESKLIAGSELMR
ncbi:MAG: SPFH domain-containing protein [Candidatus Gracilibacteria bacterium]|nr:SPFH domain-containing protein [Candidatus Gracilibacteria bacterium]